MHDEELTTILRRADAPVPLPNDVAAGIQGEMHAELDRTLEPDETLEPDANVVALVSATRPATPRSRRWTWIAAALLVAVGTAAVFLIGRSTEEATGPAATSPTVPAVVAPEEPPNELLLVACLDFIQSTQFDGTPWREHFTPNDPDATAPTPADFLQLADAIDVLITAAPDVEPAAGSLLAAASEARSADPDPPTVARQLDLAQDTLIGEFALPCLTENTD